MRVAKAKKEGWPEADPLREEKKYNCRKLWQSTAPSVIALAQAATAAFEGFPPDESVLYAARQSQRSMIIWPG